MTNNPFKDVRLIVSDFDGVMTDNKVIIDEHGKESVICNRSDGLAIELLREKKGIDVIVISKEKNVVVNKRCKKLCIDVYHGIDQKITLFKKVIQDKQLDMTSVIYVGNEVNDLECMLQSGFSVSPADGHEKVKAVATYVTRVKGGEGVIREISDFLL